MKQQIMELVDSVKECLALVIHDSSDIAKDFQAGNTGRATKKIIVYIENITCLINALQILREQQLPEFATIEINTLQTVLIEMERAMRSRDYVLLADVLQYEIKEVLVEIQSEL